MEHILNLGDGAGLYRAELSRLFPLSTRHSLPSDCEIMAVSKTQPVSAIKELMAAGYRLFGENRVQEAFQKWPDLLKEVDGCRLQLIGPLQTNKVAQAVQLFHGIEVVDRPSLVDALVTQVARPTAVTREFLIQINIGEEPQKSGVLPRDFLDLYHYCCENRLPIQGVMGIPPVHQDPTPYFQQLKTLADQANLKILSMGMSQDYETAIRWGSTRIRLGTALFGKRGGAQSGSGVDSPP
jgi:PLP dependent protein